MPSNARPRKKAKSKPSKNGLGASLDDMANITDMLGRMSLPDDQTIRSMISAAKKGSLVHLSMLCHFMPELSATHAVDAITALCAVLDVPAFPPDRPLPTSLSSFRTKALYALSGLARIPGSVLSDGHSPSHRILERNWPMMCNWLQHFRNELTTQVSMSSNFTKEILPTIVTSAMPTIISNLALCDEGFTRLTIKDDGLLDMLVKIWFSSEVFLLHPLLLAGHRYQCYALLNRSLTILDTHDASGMRLAKMVQNILHEARDDVGVVTKKLLKQLRNPAEAYKERSQVIVFTLEIILFLIDERLGNDTATKFMDSLLLGDVVRLTAQLLSFVSEDLASAPERRVVSEYASTATIECGLRLLLSSISSRNGQHWVALLFKLGFLSTVARFMSSVGCLTAGGSEILMRMFDTVIPGYLGHRFVLTSAIKAVKEITVDGDVAKLEASAMQQSWMSFTNILLERTVINTVYERDLAKYDVRECDNCEKKEQETLLFKCAGCKTAMYCSRECQTSSWKTGEHRLKCKEWQELWFLTGMGMSAGALMFLRLVALAELRRHMPGVSEHLATFNNPSGIPLKDAVFTVSFLSVPPTITVRSGDSPPKVPHEPRLVLEEDEHDRKKCRDALRKYERIFSDPLNCLPAGFQVQSFWGGRWPVSSVQPIAPNAQLFAPGKKYAGDAVVDDAYLLRRKPAKDETGKNLAFVLDEVDRHAMFARKHFRPPGAGDEESPKTIYDYIEKKVVADPEAMVWAGRQHN